MASALPPVLFAILAGLAVPAAAGAAALQPAAPDAGGLCGMEAQSGGRGPGCVRLVSINLGPMPGQLYWHVDRFPDIAAANAASTLYGSAMVASGGEVLLQTVNDNPGWTAPGGERLATIGPLTVPNGPDLAVRFTEFTLEAAADDGLASTASGSHALFVLEGSLCLETPAGARDIGPRGSAIVPGRVPSARTAREPVRALTLVIHPAREDWTAPSGDWSPSGLCRS